MSGNAMGYEQDFHGWALEQASLLREHRFSEIDIENIVEEIESMARSDRRQLASRLTVLLCHLLKWQYQPVRQGPSWSGTIYDQRISIAALVRESPSLRPVLGELLVDAYRRGRKAAADETGLAKHDFPEHCPWPIASILSEDFLPT